MIYNILSPDGFSITREGGFNTVKEALTFYDKWKMSFEHQGYYSSNSGRIVLSDLDNECIFRIQDPVNFEAYLNFKLKNFFKKEKAIAEILDKCYEVIIKSHKLSLKDCKKELDYYKGATVNTDEKSGPEDPRIVNMKNWLFDMFIENFEGFENTNAAYTKYINNVLHHAENRDNPNELFNEINSEKMNLLEVKENTFEFVKSIHDAFLEKFSDEEGANFILNHRLRSGH